MTEPDKPLVAFAKVAERFPGYVLGFIISAVISLMSDPLVTALGIGSVAVGFATNVWVAVAIFWLLYTILRMISGVATTINSNGQQVSSAIVYHANSISTPVPESVPSS